CPFVIFIYCNITILNLIVIVKKHEILNHQSKSESSKRIELDYSSEISIIFVIMQSDSRWLLDGHEVQTSDGAFVKWYDHKFFLLLHKGKKFHGEIVKDDSENNQLTIKINHRVFQVKKRGELDALIASLGLDVPKIKKLKELQAPMPGRVLKIFVKEGEEIQIGDNVLSLEAMKMENILKADGVGTVSKITISEGDVVDKGAVLIEFA
ncbi:MAG: acetyl-CoA carboxylase biotin carboxyl carrier protein subunit, partial [Crocinitomicaceae bacterium]|nr:acetyl-CoA carboxylase biotin carboxyl carrier protein subunit [Crocinitomicaceae bacterium]